MALGRELWAWSSFLWVEEGHMFDVGKPHVVFMAEGGEHLQMNVNKRDGRMGQPESLCPPPSF